MRIREGDPLEIYTSREGEVIFKKYSLLGGVEDFAAELCETMSGPPAASAPSRTGTRSSPWRAAASGSLWASGSPRSWSRSWRVGKSTSTPARPAPPGDGGIDSLLTTVAAPILAEGDLLGLVLFISSDPAAVTGDTEYKLAQTIAAFLGRHMETESSLPRGRLYSVRVFDGMKCRKDAMLEVSPNSEGAAS